MEHPEGGEDFARREPKVVLVLLGWHSGNSRAAAYSPTRKLSATNTRLCRASVGGAIGWQTDDAKTMAQKLWLRETRNARTHGFLYTRSCGCFRVRLPP